jgi:hypothetical protein
MVFGRTATVNSDYTTTFYNGSWPGKLSVNRDADDGIFHPIHVGTDPGDGNGAFLSAGGSWTDGSSRTFKENFEPLESEYLLSTISNMQVDSWNYKNSDEKHIGPIAEDFVEAFDVGTMRKDGTRENKYLAARDVAGVALAGVKELIQIIEKQNAKIEQLERQVANLSKNK